MRRRQFLAGLGALAVSGWLTGCGLLGTGNQLRANVDRAEPTSVGEGPAGMCSLGTRLAAQLSDEAANLLVSPLSVSIALAMVRNGVDGAAADQVDEVLGVGGLDELNESYNTVVQVIEGRSGTFDDGGSKGSVSVELACQVFAAEGVEFTQPFLERLGTWYGSGVDLVDFAEDPRAAAKQINRWCADQTHDQITAIAPEDGLDPLTVFLLANALYFKGSWLDPMSPSSTEDQPFTTGAGDQISVPTMHTTTHEWTSGQGWQATRVRYSGAALAMAVFLPDEGTSTREVLEQWGTDGLANALEEWDRDTTRYELSLAWPKWQSSWGAQDLRASLEALGVDQIFQPGGFAPMSSATGLHVSGVLHKTWIRVDEEGTEAAAVTVDQGAGAQEAEFKDMDVNRPFIYVIHDVETKTPLFLGVVNDPRASG